MIRLNKILCFVTLCLCFSFIACKKVAKDVAENVAEKTIAKQSSKEAAKDILKKTGKKELKEITWHDLHSAISKEMPALGSAIDKLDGAVRNAFEKVCSKDFRFVRALTSSNSVLDRCKVYSAEAPALMKDANFIRMFVKSDIARNEGRHCLIDDLIAKEEKGFVKFYQKGTGQLTAEYRDGIVNVYDKAFLNQELIPNARYTIKGEAGKRCSFNIDDLGRIQSIEAKYMSPDEIVSDIINRTGSNDFGKDWDKAFRTLKQSSGQDDINIKCAFSYANNDDVAPKFVRIDADIKGKKKVSSSFKNHIKRAGHTFSAEENNAILKKYSSKLKLSPEKSQKLLSEMNSDDGLAALIHENPEFNIIRWTKTRNNVVKKDIVRTPKGRMPINARTYAGNVYYFNPHLNKGLQARLRAGNGMADLRGMSSLSYDDLVRLDKLYPDGVPFTKQGFPDFSHVAAKGKDGKTIKIDIGELSGDSKKDIYKAETIFQNQGNQWAEGFTWHHIEGSTSLLRVPTQIHQLVDHTGGMSMSGLK